MKRRIGSTICARKRGVKMKITLRNQQTGHEIGTKQGFCWTTVFFGALVPLFRGDLKWALIMFVVHALVAVVTFGIGLLVTYLVFGFIYNGRYISDLQAKGYQVVR